jgi:hypothetical protein
VKIRGEITVQYRLLWLVLRETRQNDDIVLLEIGFKSAADKIGRFTCFQQSRFHSWIDEFYFYTAR